MSIELRRARSRRMSLRRVRRRTYSGAPPGSSPDDSELIAKAMESLPTGWGEPPAGWLLEALGFYGLARVEEGLLLALVTGEPVLLVGRHGTAKTAISCALGEVLGLRFHAYDAAKALFEDVVGFPDPRSLQKGEVCYVPTPMSIWDKECILVDELSRAQPQMQNKWLEVIRSRRLMGRPLPRLRYVLAAMNPTDYLGAVPLDEALLSRFAVVVRMPEVSEMSEATALRVIAARSADDAPLLGQALSGAPENGERIRLVRRRIRGQITAAWRRLPAVEALFGRAVITYVHEVALHLAERDNAMDARRLGMIRRNLLVALCLAAGARSVKALTAPSSLASGNGMKKDTGGATDPFLALGAPRERIAALVGRTLHLSLPFVAEGRPGPSAEMLGLIHQSAFDQAFEESGPRDNHDTPERSLARGPSGRRQLLAYRTRLEELPPEEHYRVANGFLKRAQEAPTERLTGAWEDLLALASLVRERSEAVPWEITEHLLDSLALRLGVAELSESNIVTLCSVVGANPQLPVEARLARQCLGHVTRTTRGDLDEAIRLYRRLTGQGEQP